MIKVKLNTSIPHTNTSLQESDYIVRPEVIDGAFVVRYFKVFPSSKGTPSVVLESLTGLNPSSISLLSQNTHTEYFVGSCVTDKPELADSKMLEIGRHIFRPTIGNGSVLGAAERRDFALFVLPFNGVDAIGEPYNHFVESAQVKGAVSRNSRITGKKPVFMLYSDVADAPIDEWTLFYVDTSAFVLEDKTTGQWSDQSEFASVSLLPEFAVQAPASVVAGGACSVSLSMMREGQLVNYSGEIQIEVVNGYAPNSRASVVNGVASINVIALGLNAGDQVRFKLGTKNISGLADVTIPVV